jgi:hypothetical protein
MSKKMDIFMACKKSHDAKHDKENPQYKSRRKIAQTRREKTLVDEFLNNENEDIWREKLKGKIVNGDFMGQLVLEFAQFYIQRYYAQNHTTPQASNVYDQVRTGLQLLRSHKSIPTGRTNTKYLVFGDLFAKSENFRKFWSVYKLETKTRNSITPAYTQDLAILGAACSPFPAELALHAFILMAPLAVSITHSLETW